MLLNPPSCPSAHSRILSFTLLPHQHLTCTPRGLSTPLSHRFISDSRSHRRHASPANPKTTFQPCRGRMGLSSPWVLPAAKAERQAAAAAATTRKQQQRRRAAPGDASGRQAAAAGRAAAAATTNGWRRRRARRWRARMWRIWECSGELGGRRGVRSRGRQGLGCRCSARRSWHLACCEHAGRVAAEGYVGGAQGARPQQRWSLHACEVMCGEQSSHAHSSRGRGVTIRVRKWTVHLMSIQHREHRGSKCKERVNCLQLVQGDSGLVRCGEPLFVPCTCVALGPKRASLGRCSDNCRHAAHARPNDPPFCVIRGSRHVCVFVHLQFNVVFMGYFGPGVD